jgi:hypothetical protein
MSSVSRPRTHKNREIAALARFSVDRLKRAIELYWALSEPHTQEAWQLERRRLSIATLMVDSLAGIDAAIHAIRLSQGFGIARNRYDDLLGEILRQADSATIRSDIESRSMQLTRVRDLRNAFLHAGRLPPASSEALSAARDAISIALYLFLAFPELRAVWGDIENASWEFLGQSAFLATQVREAFAGKLFPNLTATLRVDRDTSGDQFTLVGAFRSVGNAYSYFWRQNGSVPDTPNIFNTNCIDVGTVETPAVAFDTDSGQVEHEGTLECVIRHVEARFDGLAEASNPLLTPIRLLPESDASWAHGPGNVQIDYLKISLPYRVRTCWYRTPEPRFHAVSTSVVHSMPGTVNGKLSFFLRGHCGKPTIRGSATMVGNASPIEQLVQRAEWDMLGGDIMQWAGVSRLRLRARLKFRLAFSDF